MQDDRKMAFLSEIQNKVQNASCPLLIGGDFNLVRRVEDKSSGQVNVRFMSAFNEMIKNVAVRELYRNDSRYTWSNKQMCLF